jgi:hypothetical protein
MGSCAAGQVCADQPSSSFGAGLCVWKNADTDCAGLAGYPLIHKYYSGVIDTRGCALGSCGCGGPTGVSCSLAAVTSFTTATCSDAGSRLTDLTPGHCNVVGPGQILGMTTTVAGTGHCDTTGSPATSGSVAVDPATAITVCCSR